MKLRHCERSAAISCYGISVPSNNILIQRFSNRMSRLRGALLGLLFFPFIAGAGEVVESSVALDSGIYSVDVLVRIEAPLEVVFQAITDYDNLTEINSSIVESYIVETQGADKYRVFSRVKFCVLFFCKHVRQVQDMIEYRPALIKATVLPELSDLSGSASWDLVVADDVTYMQFSTEVDPAFWVPPLIGPWMLEREMVKQVLKTAMYIERQVDEDS